MGGVLLFIVLLTSLGQVNSSGGTSVLHNVVRTAFRPIERGTIGLIGHFERIYDQMFRFDELENEHHELQIAVSAYRQAARVAEELREENERLRALLELPTRNQYLQLLDARVSTWDASSWTSAFTIDRGLDDGLEIGHPVVNEREELLGVIRQAGANWATVETIVDPAFRAGGMFGNGIPAVAAGNFALMNSRQLRLSYIPTGDIPQLGDTVVTSGLGERIPLGLVIGEVVHVELEAGGASYFAIVDAAADFLRLTQVFIVLGEGYS